MNSLWKDPALWLPQGTQNPSPCSNSSVKVSACARAAFEGELIEIGEIRGAHGIKGAFKVRSFTDQAEDLASYGALYDQDGKYLMEPEVLSIQQRELLCSADTISSRSEAEQLKGQKLFVPKEALPAKDDDEFFGGELEGLNLTIPGDPQILGRVVKICDFGASEILVCETDKGEEWLIPFTYDFVLSIDLEGQLLTLHEDALQIKEINGNQNGLETEESS